MTDMYLRLKQGLSLLTKTDCTSLFIKGPPGVGKSYQTDNFLTDNGADFVVFRGDISDAFIHQFIYENNKKGRILIFRDVGKMLRRINFIDTMKALTETNGKRIIKRLTYAEHDVPSEFEFEGKLIFEVNSIQKRYQEDLDALFSRGDFVELNPSFDDIKATMGQICQTAIETEVTDYLISNSNYIGVNVLNLRTQQKVFQLYQMSIDKGVDWKEQIKLYLESETSEARKLLYKVSGYNPIKRIDFVKFLMRTKGWSYSSCQRKTNEYKLLGEIYSNGLQKQELLSLKEGV